MKKRLKRIAVILTMTLIIQAAIEASGETQTEECLSEEVGEVPSEIQEQEEFIGEMPTETIGEEASQETSPQPSESPERQEYNLKVTLEDGSSLSLEKLICPENLTSGEVTYPADYGMGVYRIHIPEGTKTLSLDIEGMSERENVRLTKWGGYLIELNQKWYLCPDTPIENAWTMNGSNYVINLDKFMIKQEELTLEQMDVYGRLKEDCEYSEIFVYGEMISAVLLIEAEKSQNDAEENPGNEEQEQEPGNEESSEQTGNEESGEQLESENFSSMGASEENGNIDKADNSGTGKTAGGSTKKVNLVSSNTKTGATLPGSSQKNGSTDSTFPSDNKIQGEDEAENISRQKNGGTRFNKGIVSIVSGINAFLDYGNDTIKNLGKENHYDKNTGIDMRDNEEDILPWYVKLEVKPELLEEDCRDGIQKVLKSRGEVYALHDIHLINILENTEYRPDELIRVSIPMLDRGKYKNTAIVHIRNDGTMEFLEAQISENYLEFDTDEFSAYGIVGFDGTMEDLMNGEQERPFWISLIPGGAAALLLLLLTLIRITGSTKRRKRER